MRQFLILFVLVCIGVAAVAGFRGSNSRKPPLEFFNDMVRQNKIRPQTPNDFFPDHMASRLPVSGTIARGSHYQEIPEYTGRVPGTTNFVETSPIALSSTLLARGRERYQISCVPCHGPQADGNGITKKYGMVVVANLHDKRIVSMTDGEIFNTITYGKGLMGPYGQNVASEDRWAIIAYLRALQLSHLGTIEDVPSDLRAALRK
jgi:mono/diheme cytochrome c family protein